MILILAVALFSADTLGPVPIKLATITPQRASHLGGWRVIATFEIGVPMDRTDEFVILSPGGDDTVERTAHVPLGSRVKVGLVVTVEGVLSSPAIPRPW